MTKLTLIKLGGSVITDKTKFYTPRPETIKNLAHEIRLAWNKGYRFVIAHGSGSFGHTSAAKYRTAEGLKNEESVYGLAIVQQDAITINRIVNKIFLKEELPVLSFVPSSFSFSRSKKLRQIFTWPIIEALKINALPLVFGDIILDDKIGCCIFSGEKTLDNLLCPLKKAGFEIDRVIQAGSTNGVYDSEGQTIPKITLKGFSQIKKMIQTTKTIDVTGGMLHKIEESLVMAEQGIESLIINGEVKGNLFKAIQGKNPSGTLIVN
ncbi:MAG: isopentenyl phosphate kinase [Patescibacteria group bacterium]|jgi:isopentenyl phosphate kinase